ncbi:MAG TPA: MBL fold metallo-hydrolase [Sphingomonas sp.]|jgi:glyoxylase-like metal-dependent hydrolase (beta-lactamase superfamily II)
MATASLLGPRVRSGLTYPLGDLPTGEPARVAPGVAMLRIAVPGPLRHVNCWLLDDEGGVAVVDTGMDTPDARAVWDAAALPSVTQVIGTHFHPDHIGLAGRLCAEHAAPLVMTRGECLLAKLLIADARDAVPPEVVAWWRMAGWSDEAVAAASAKGWARFRRIVSPLPHGFTRIADGDRMAIGAAEWRVVVGSGHSPEHACLLDERTGVLLAGDQVLPRISPNVSLSVNEPQADPLGEWLSSIDKLRALDPDLLVLPGHGDPFTGLHVRLDAMEREHLERLDALQAWLAEPRRAADCFAVLFARTIGPDMLGMATGEALAHLRRLERDGRAVAEDADGVRWWRAA